MYQQYVNEARARQHEQDLQQEAATERALRTTRQEQPPPMVAEPRLSYSRRLLRALASLL